MANIDFINSHFYIILKSGTDYGLLEEWIQYDGSPKWGQYHLIYYMYKNALYILDNIYATSHKFNQTIDISYTQ